MLWRPPKRNLLSNAFIAMRALVKLSNEMKSHFSILFNSFANEMYSQVDACNLALIRIVFGLLMFFDTINERGLSSAENRWNNASLCHFPLLPFLKPLAFEWMCLLYFSMILGSIGITIGYRFKLSCILHLIPYAYILLLEKSYWNNHSYLFALIIFILTFSDANAVWSFDSFGKERKAKFLDYFILRFQVSLVYFYAGLKKANFEWIGGHSMYYLSEHWVFTVFRLLLSNEDIDLFVVHWGGFLIDISVGFLLLIDKTRSIAYFMCALFNLMNSRMFSIGMFPYVMLAVTPIYSSPDWPKKVIKLFKKEKKDKEATSTIIRKQHKLTRKQRFMCYFTIAYMSTQMFLPFSHTITQGYNTWTNGLYGYSWDMMLHNWKVHHKRIKLIANDGDIKMYIDVDRWTPNTRWTHHADMLKQLAVCVQQRFLEKGLRRVQLYFDIWISLNGRLTQRIYNPKVDIVEADWSPFQKPKWVLPVLTELTEWRSKIKTLETQAETPNTQLAFYADFAGFEIKNYVGPDVHNAKLLALSGWAVVHIENGPTRVVTRGDEIKLNTSSYHSIKTIKSEPFCFAYTYTKDSKGSLTNSDTLGSQCNSSKESAFNRYKRSLQLILWALRRVSRKLVAAAMNPLQSLLFC